MSHKPLQVNTEIKIKKPVSEVFDAIINPNKLVGYFVSRSTGPIEDGKTVMWFFADVGDNIKVEVTGQKIEKDTLISFTWKPWETETMVTITLDPTPDGRTHVRINEDGWDKDDNGIKGVIENTQGWVGFLAGLKAYLEHNINLREDSI